MDYDVFISHASENKKEVARPLADTLRRHGLKVWLDEFELCLGDSLRRSIDHGLAQSRFGVVILSPEFFKKEWPQRELDGLVTREVRGGKVILPIWHNINHDQILEYSPTLADKLGVSTERGLEYVAQQIFQVIKEAPPISPTTQISYRRSSNGITKFVKVFFRGAVVGAIIGIIIGLIGAVFDIGRWRNLDEGILIGLIFGMLSGGVINSILRPIFKYMWSN